MNVGETILILNFILNRVVIKNIEIIPYEGWNERKINVTFQRTWSCFAKVNFASRSRVCVFEYANNNMTYKFLLVIKNYIMEWTSPCHKKKASVNAAKPLSNSK
jgi:hypothetical protein